jgi:hypothetical protein
MPEIAPVRDWKEEGSSSPTPARWRRYREPPGDSARTKLDAASANGLFPLNRLSSVSSSDASGTLSRLEVGFFALLGGGAPRPREERPLTPLGRAVECPLVAGWDMLKDWTAWVNADATLTDVSLRLSPLTPFVLLGLPATVRKFPLNGT